MSKDAEREQRLAEALRANLKRRKAQQRALEPDVADAQAADDAPQRRSGD